MLMNKIPKRNKWTYSIGCIGRDMVFILVSMFILPYIQYTMNLSVLQFSTVAGIMVFARIWDAINDPHWPVPSWRINTHPSYRECSFYV